MNRSITLERTENKLIRNAGRKYRNFERSTEVSELNMSPFGINCGQKYFPKISDQETFHISKDDGPCVLSVPK